MLVIGLLTVTASGQRTPRERLLRFRTEQNFRRGIEMPRQPLLIRRNPKHYKMELHRFQRTHFMNPRVRNRIVMRNRMMHERMFFKKHHLFKNRRVI